MFKCFRRNQEITFDSLSTHKLRLTCFSVNLDVLEKNANGYYSRRGVLYRKENSRYELVCEERSSFKTKLVCRNVDGFEGLDPELHVVIDKDVEGELKVTVTYKDITLLFGTPWSKSVTISTNIDSLEKLEHEFYKLHKLGMYEVYDLFIDFSASLRGFLQISDEEYKELLKKKTKELWVRKEGK